MFNMVSDGPTKQQIEELISLFEPTTLKNSDDILFEYLLDSSLTSSKEHLDFFARMVLQFVAFFIFSA